MTAIIAAWPMIKRLLPLIGGALLLLAALLWLRHWGNQRYNQGVDDLAAKWTAAELVAERQAAQLARQRQAAIDAAEAASAERDRLYQIVNRPIQNEVTAYVKTPAAAARCADADGVRLGQKSIDAANAAVATAR